MTPPARTASPERRCASGRARKGNARAHVQSINHKCGRSRGIGPAFGHIDTDNRPSQAVFVCARCGATDNADANASRVIAQRGVIRIFSGAYREPDRKCTMRLPQEQRGPEQSDVTPAETKCSRGAGSSPTVGSTKDTPRARQRHAFSGGRVHLSAGNRSAKYRHRALWSWRPTPV
ncbi:zinc ribbon domain-containing protein [Thiomonas sp. FB-Cd]|uniref:zinc ribbon domain-containing protein n=1 Tax=Thiomonas sp. FB-Cd TaxID=1158292 RepID=UPI00350F38F4